MSDQLLAYQFAELFLRHAADEVSLGKAIQEAVAIANRPQAIGDEELHAVLDKIRQAHRAKTLNTIKTGRWAGAPTQNAIAGLVNIGKHKGRLRYVRDAYYTLRLKLPPFQADEDEPLPDGMDLRSVPA
ncbi:hypothetical protein [Umezawaea sp. Da 62-37]|uniref:hypothetical protein n=1 Tax=Umezawaea sp. Da 62-37 TaxID=3075927 RepID=UPI0028F6CA50|nr:hypothetical protein [Umezawaea sp. Da 62-37]WNV82910.1 hypothetical protein RM788_32555 [Umezawaea sp. Da 62-37]